MQPSSFLSKMVFDGSILTDGSTDIATNINIKDLSFKFNIDSIECRGSDMTLCDVVVADVLSNYNMAYLNTINMKKHEIIKDIKASPQKAYYDYLLNAKIVGSVLDNTNQDLTSIEFNCLYQPKILQTLDENNICPNGAYTIEALSKIYEDLMNKQKNNEAALVHFIYNLNDEYLEFQQSVLAVFNDNYSYNCSIREIEYLCSTEDPEVAEDTEFYYNYLKTHEVNNTSPYQPIIEIPVAENRRLFKPVIITKQNVSKGVCDESVLAGFITDSITSTGRLEFLPLIGKEFLQSLAQAGTNFGVMNFLQDLEQKVRTGSIGNRADYIQNRLFSKALVFGIDKSKYTNNQDYSKAMIGVVVGRFNLLKEGFSHLSDPTYNDKLLNENKDEFNAEVTLCLQNIFKILYHDTKSPDYMPVYVSLEGRDQAGRLNIDTTYSKIKETNPDITDSKSTNLNVLFNLMKKFHRTATNVDYISDAIIPNWILKSPAFMESINEALEKHFKEARDKVGATVFH